jgi:MFS superfamily sulfate permease-like transporter
VLVQTRREANPEIVPLGRIPGSKAFADTAVRADLETFPGVVILRLQGSLYFSTVNALRNHIWALIENNDLQIKAFILDFGMTYFSDLEGSDVLQSVKRGLDLKHIELLLAGVHDNVMGHLEDIGVDQVIGSSNFYKGIDDALEAFLMESAAIKGEL